MPNQRRRSKARLAYGEKGSVLSEFLTIFSILLALIFCAAVVAFDLFKRPDAKMIGLELAGMACLLSMFITFVINFLPEFLSKRLYLGSDKRDDAGIMRGMYKQADYLRWSNRYDESEKIYRQILKEYPEELEARFFLGDMLWKDLNKGTQALKAFKALENTIREKGLDFQYREVLKENIQALKEQVVSPKKI